MDWNDLSMAEKAEVMKIAVDGGVYDLDAIRNGYNEYAKGGKIHIKPENRGKFTALKERTGHYATWFKQHGTPAQKKMATFAINARKWKHEDGGNLYWPGGEVSDVDTRSDTTRAGFHEGTPAYGAVDAPNTAGLWDLLNYNVTRNQHIITGEPIIPVAGKVLGNNFTRNLLKMLGKSRSVKPAQPLSNVNVLDLAAEGYGSRYPGVEKQIELFNKRGVDLSKIGVEDLDNIYKLRLASIAANAPARHTVATPKGEGYTMKDYQNGEIVGETDLWIDSRGNAHMENIRNTTEHLSSSNPKKAHNVQRNSLNAAIAVAKSEGGEGVITGSYLQSAPKQYPAIFEHPEREIIGKGFHTNEKMVEEPFGGINGPKEAKSVEELWANSDKEAMQLREAPVWKLTKQTRKTPVKSDVFDPIIVDENGVMHTDWNALDIFKNLAFPITTGIITNKAKKYDRKAKK